MAQLGFLGLGIMGYPMARHLLEAGHEVALWTHSAAKARELAAKGKGTACATPKEVAQRSDFICYCVGDTAMTRAVSIGKDGLIEGMRPRKRDRGLQHHFAHREHGDRRDVRRQGRPLPGRALHRVESRRGRRDPYVHGGRRPGGFRARSSPTSRPWANVCIYCGPAGQGLQAKLDPEPGHGERDASIQPRDWFWRSRTASRRS